MVSYGFDHLRLHKVSADVFEFNPASARVLAVVGLWPTARGALRLAANGFTHPTEKAFVNWFHDRHSYGVLVDEWKGMDTQVDR